MKVCEEKYVSFCLTLHYITPLGSMWNKPRQKNCRMHIELVGLCRAQKQFITQPSCDQSFWSLLERYLKVNVLKAHRHDAVAG